VAAEMDPPWNDPLDSSGDEESPDWPPTTHDTREAGGDRGEREEKGRRVGVSSQSQNWW